MAAMAIPAVVPETPEEVVLPESLKTPELPDAALDEAAEVLPVVVAPLSKVDPGVKGIAGLM